MDFFIAVVVIALSIFSVPSSLDIHLSLLTFYVCSIAVLFSKFILRKWLLAFGKKLQLFSLFVTFYSMLPRNVHDFSPL